VFISPVTFLGYRQPLKRQAIFTVIYASGILLFRGLQRFLSLPFGTHMILLIILNTVLLTLLIKEISWTKSILISLTVFTIMLINDALVVVPFMKYSNISINDIETGGLLSFFVSAILANLLLITAYIAGVLKSLKKQSYNL